MSRILVSVGFRFRYRGSSGFFCFESLGFGVSGSFFWFLYFFFYFFHLRVFIGAFGLRGGRSRGF